MIRTKFASLAFAGALSLAGGLSAQAEELSFAHFVPPGHTLTAAVIEPLAESVGESSDLTIRVYPGGELGKGPLEQYVRVVQGVADIVWGLPGYTSSQFQKTMIAEMPGVIADGEPGYPAIWNAMELIESEFPATKPLAVWTSEPNVFIMKDKEIRSPEDLAGLKMRVAGSTSALMIEALGATPVQMPAGEIYNALQTGLIDGVVTGSSAIADFKLNEVANSYTIGAPLGRLTFYVVMNQGRYDGLTDEQKAAIDAVAGAPLSESAEKAWNALADKTIAMLEADPAKTVINLSDEEVAAFGAVTEPLTAKLVADLGAEDVFAAMSGE
ncbi:TRAP-type C4-dicarboxylate transport system, substrate-binding protein [Pseudooceanicola antarcticus]|uniref:C4-dicarboxylate ABC transporter substrate-binding protein n=1 Tax=Pseudooceanicola antarcticus TaxID=1247613 RepID=A0A285HV65_9RHOB|nr:TRAP transporter substrate-binding protein [Pseudooceanicola antarcticus]PJE27450.1 C4-dicarboxylate ABC transporter substrate-binding protein [Pseudooceanicola antarcticus]SNY39628.1 TRAP-type C4-dicarboxylate transport system, substrate-binding protein [Pseudooceanicola antarcticus]